MLRAVVSLNQAYDIQFFSINDRAIIWKFSKLTLVVGNDDRCLEDRGISNDGRESSAAEKVRVVHELTTNDRTFGT